MGNDNIVPRGASSDPGVMNLLCMISARSHTSLIAPQDKRHRTRIGADLEEKSAISGGETIMRWARGLDPTDPRLWIWATAAKESTRPEKGAQGAGRPLDPRC